MRAPSFEAAGAVYVLEQREGKWEIIRRVLAASPRKYGLFGFNVVVDEERLVINYLEGNARVSNVCFGEPASCEVAL